MKSVRLIILSIALAAAIVAGFVAMQLAKPRVVTTEPQVQREPVVYVLAASENLGVGVELNPRLLQWIRWPQQHVPAGAIQQQDRPNADQELAGSIVRMPLFAGEIVRPEKIVDGAGGRLSSLLPAGKRALSVDVTASSSAGGLILPNDRVDVIALRTVSGAQVPEVVLSNIRVLAIDQAMAVALDEDSGILGSTATLELTLDQARILTLVKASSKELMLGLRSVADAGQADTEISPNLLSTANKLGYVQIIKSGLIQESTEKQGTPTGMNSEFSNAVSKLLQTR